MKHTPLINTSSGPIYGLDLDDINVFLAIPYAKAPINELRFAPPQPASWEESRDCTQPGTLAPQMPSRLAAVLGDQQTLEQSEDCLHLSIWAPSSITEKEQQKPVLIWIHGGAWMTGGASLDWYDGEHLAKTGDMVVINVNYRLGPLGWLYVPEQTANAGLQDLAQATEWIKENVHLFGG
ncbi:carboxylesterase family protein [Paenalcaligenes faecalis]|uniref:carboxylesterase family protein n=1 Tax=Paenalcaligenes faecalis TaxID=2980099 RepID=UPI0022B973BC|nr:carboxylesterase family protein [Paenalcaligenes faecalis]